MKGLSLPLGIAFDQSGNVYVANRIGSSSGNVVVYAPGGKSPVRTITDGITSVAVTVNERGWLYVANLGTNSILEFPPGSVKPLRRQISEDLDDPQGLAYSPPLLP